MAEAQVAAGITPTVSSDLHSRAMHGPTFDLPTTMAKLVAAGMSLSDVIAGATHRPAEVLHLPDGVGTLRPGAPADIAVFTVDTGSFDVFDVHGETRSAPLRLINTATFVAGRLLPPAAAEPPPPWVPLTAAQQNAERQRVDAVRDAGAPRLHSPDQFDQPFPRPEQ